MPKAWYPHSDGLKKKKKRNKKKKESNNRVQQPDSCYQRGSLKREGSAYNLPEDW